MCKFGMNIRKSSDVKRPFESKGLLGLFSFHVPVSIQRNSLLDPFNPSASCSKRRVQDENSVRVCRFADRDLTK